MSDSKNIFSDFIEAQKGFSAALKTSSNPHFRSRYAALDACIEAVIDSLHKNGFALMQKTLDCENGVRVETIFIHKSGGVISGGVLSVPAVKSDPQGYGSALTYARRYGLMAACGIAPEDDDGNSAADAKNRQDVEKAKKEAEKWEHRKADLDALLRGCKTLDELQKAWATVYKECAMKGDKAGEEALGKVKDAMKEKLSGAGNE